MRGTQGGVVFEIDAALRGFAAMIGFNFANPILRYVVVTIVYAVIVAVSLFGDNVLAAVALGIGFVGITAAARQWAWRRGQIQQAILDAEDLSSVVPDRGNDGIVTALLLVVLSPLLFYRMNGQPGAFSMPDSYDPLTPWPWIMLTVGELAKAVPIIDYSEIYGIRNFSGIAANTFAAQSAVFLTRALDDFVLLNAFFAYVQQAGALRHATSLIGARTPNFELLAARLQQFSLVFFGIPRLPLPQSFISASQLLTGMRDPLRRAAYLTGMISVPIRRTLERRTTSLARPQSDVSDVLPSALRFQRDRRSVNRLLYMLDEGTYHAGAPQFLKLACANARVDLYRWTMTYFSREQRRDDEVRRILQESLRESLGRFAAALDRVHDYDEATAAALIYELGLVFSYTELSGIRHSPLGIRMTGMLEPFSAFDKIRYILLEKFSRHDPAELPDRQTLSADEEVLFSSYFFTLIAATRAWGGPVHEEQERRLGELLDETFGRYNVSPEFRDLMSRRTKGVVRNQYREWASDRFG